MKDISVRIIGLGGQGIVWLSKKLGLILAEKGYEHITVMSDYDTITRGGKVNAEVMASEGRINSPYISKADVLIVQRELGDKDALNADKIFVEKSICPGNKLLCRKNNVVLIDFKEKARRENRRVNEVLLEFLQNEISDTKLSTHQ